MLVVGAFDFTPMVLNYHAPSPRDSLFIVLGSEFAQGSSAGACPR